MQWEIYLERYKSMKFEKLKIKKSNVDKFKERI